MSQERMEGAQQQLKTIPKEDHAKVKALAAIVKPLRSVLFKTPDDHSMTGWRDDYNHFGRHPEKVIAFFDKHMK